MDEKATRKMLELLGSIPTIPIILCKNLQTSQIVSAALHQHMTSYPDIMILDDWPDTEENALVVTPLVVLGTNQVSDFSIPITEKLSSNTRKVLNACIQLETRGELLSVRNIAKATGLTTRIADVAISELVENKLAIRQGDYKPVRLTFGRWSIDAAVAKAHGIEITEYKTSPR